jgi:hypothetical protein
MEVGGRDTVTARIPAMQKCTSTIELVTQPYVTFFVVSNYIFQLYLIIR